MIEPCEKKCKKCHEIKLSNVGFYTVRGVLRNECKECTKRLNIAYQKKHQSWKHKFVNGDPTRDYMREYYQNNKEKFAEYRRRFKERHPGYYREYLIKRKSGTQFPKQGDSK